MLKTSVYLFLVNAIKSRLIHRAFLLEYTGAMTDLLIFVILAEFSQQIKKNGIHEDFNH